MFDELTAMKKAIEDAKTAARTNGAAAFKAAFKAIFDKHPTLLGVRWDQYTPYFNDGDACTFSVHEPYMKLDTTAEDAGDYEDGFDSRWSLRDNPAAKDLLLDVEALFAAVDDEVMLATFGDHVRMTATREGIEVDERSHD